MGDANVPDVAFLPISQPFDEVVDMSDLDLRLTRLESQVSEINVSQAKLLQAIEGYRGNQESYIADMRRMLNRHDELIMGFQDKPGLNIKVDRLENAERNRTFHIRALWTAVAGGAVHWLIRVISGK